MNELRELQESVAKAVRKKEEAQDSIKSRWEAHKRDQGFWKSIFLTEGDTNIRVESYNEIFSELPEEIEISPEIASVLAEDQEEFNKAQKAAMNLLKGKKGGEKSL